MEDPSDHHLLQLYAGHGSQAAFRSLEGRYSGMVYGVAMRRLARHDLAAEVAQDVFLLLASKAGDVRDGALGAWLHRVAIRKANDLAKKEQRHFQREREYASLQPGETADTTAADESGALLENLDDAIDRLPVADREVILLRYVEQMDISTLATHLKISAEACQKRCERARLRLARLLALPAAAAGLQRALGSLGSLALCLPEVPLTRLPAQTLHAAAEARRGRVLSWKRTWSVCAGVAVIACAVVAYWSARTAVNQSPAATPSMVRRPLPQTPAVVSVVAAVRAPALPVAPVHLELDLPALAALLERADEGDTTATRTAATMLNALGAAELETAMQRIPGLELPLNQLRLVALGTLQRLASLDGRRAVLTGSMFWRAWHGSQAPRLWAIIMDGWQRWAREDHAAAVAWWQAAAEESLASNKSPDTFQRPAEPDDAALATARNYVSRAGDHAARVALAWPLLQPGQATGDAPPWSAVAEVWIQKLPLAESMQLADDLLAAVPPASSVHDSMLQTLLDFRIAVISSRGCLPSSENLLWAATEDSRPRGETIAAAVLAWAMHNTAGTAAWVAAMPDGADRQEAVSALHRLLAELAAPSVPVPDTPLH